ncbi:hypothetical protein, partial [Vibrio cholerae]|uniref:hypothetical protein n=1 Tax=Vibrio cholerae TaxID=666 RepID=UPI001A7F1017
PLRSISQAIVRGCAYSTRIFSALSGSLGWCEIPPPGLPLEGGGVSSMGSKAVAFNHVSLDTLAHIEVNNLYEWFGVQI